MALSKNQISLRQFNLQIDQSKNEVRRLYKKRRRRIAASLFRGFVAQNPVDTGYSRSNWRFGVNGDVSDILNIPQKKFGGGANRPAIGPEQALARGMAFIATIKVSDMVIIGNNTSYILVLEEGGSSQARGGIIKPVLFAVKLRYSL